MKDVYEMLEKAFGIDTEDLMLQFSSMGITFRGYTVYVSIGKNNRKKISVEDVIRYYAYEAGNLSSGCRTIAGLSGDWRPIDALAKQCLEIYKVLKKNELKKTAHKYNMELKS
jgi:hypothetical protein